MSIERSVQVVVNKGDLESKNYPRSNPPNVPYLSVSPIQDVEEPSTNGIFRLTLSSSLEENITVDYTLGGTATEGVDYETVGNVIIPAGSVTHDVEIVPIVAGSDPTETITLTLNPNSAYRTTSNTKFASINQEPVPTAILNTSDKASQITLSEGDLRATADGTQFGFVLVRADIAHTTGKHYFEAEIMARQSPGSSSTLMVGICGDNTEHNTAGAAIGPNADFVRISNAGNGSPTGSRWDSENNSSIEFGGDIAANVHFADVGDIIAFEIDFDIGQLTIRNVSGDTSQVTGLTINNGATTPFIGFNFFNTDSVRMNFGASAFSGTVPSGYAQGWGTGLPIQP